MTSFAHGNSFDFYSHMKINYDYLPIKSSTHCTPFDSHNNCVNLPIKSFTRGIPFVITTCNCKNKHILRHVDKPVNL